MASSSTRPCPSTTRTARCVAWLAAGVWAWCGARCPRPPPRGRPPARPPSLSRARAQGDPFANGYLTEDEIEFPDDYTPAPYVPDRAAAAIFFLYSARGASVAQLAARFRLPSERVCAIIMIKRREPEMVATGRVNADVDRLLRELYGSKFAPGARSLAAADAGAAALDEARGAGAFDRGVRYTLLRDDQLPDDVMPVRRAVGNVLRQRHALPVRPPPPPAARAHGSKFAFKDISGRATDRTRPRTVIISDFDGAVRGATNAEALYRSWQARVWGLDESKAGGLPYDEADADKPANFRVAP